MTYRLASAASCLAGLLLLSVPGAAATVASCNATFTVCGIQENTLLQLPFTTFAGDVVLTDLNGTAVSDVFRIFNNLINTGAGTGIGNMALLYSADDGILPPPSTYSANAVFLPENPSGYTSYVGPDGRDYVLGVPEPRTFSLFGFAIGAITLLARRRCIRFRGGLSCDPYSC